VHVPELLHQGVAWQASRVCGSTCSCLPRPMMMIARFRAPLPPALVAAPIGRHKQSDGPKLKTMDQMNS